MIALIRSPRHPKTFKSPCVRIPGRLSINISLLQFTFVRSDLRRRSEDVSRKSGRRTVFLATWKRYIKRSKTAGGSLCERHGIDCMVSEQQGAGQAREPGELASTLKSTQRRQPTDTFLKPSLTHYP